MVRPTFYATPMIHLPSCCVPAPHVGALRRLATEKGCSVSDLIRLAIENLVEHPEQIVVEDA